MHKFGMLRLPNLQVINFINHQLLRQLNSNSLFSKPIEIMSLPIVYRSLDAILETLHKDEFKKLQPVEDLLRIYHQVHQENTSTEGSERTRRYPFVILEGLDGSGKSTIAKKVTKSLSGIKWCTPPDIIKPIREWFDQHPVLRTAYYALGNYIAALQISSQLTSNPIVMDRYWHSTAAYALGQSIADSGNQLYLPEKSDCYYEWPEDLLKPDIVVFLEVSEHLRQQRHERRNTTNTKQEQLLKNDDTFRENVCLAYRNMRNPGVSVVRNVRIKQTVEEIVQIIQKVSEEKNLLLRK